MATVYSDSQFRTIFQKPFNLAVWTDILRVFFKAKELKVTPEVVATTDDTTSGYYLGNIDTKDSYRIGLFHYEIRRGSVANKLVGLRNLVRTFINPNWGEFDAALVTFDSGDHWRLSFISDIKGEETHPKRYSYVFGNAGLRYNTPLERFALLSKDGITFSSLRKAFSVEALSDKFFDSYREHYADFVQYVTGKRFVKVGNKWVERVDTSSPNDVKLYQAFGYDDKRVRDYVKKMLGRITFLHFLQRKGWMNEDLNYMQNLFEKSTQKDNFLDAVLEPLFFGILNTKPDQRQKLFEDKNWDLALLEEWRDIPYLNGGLFEQDAEDEPESIFPAELFNKLFNFFGEYNFTIDENDPRDAEIGVDPEMLGKIFENLLEDNKDKGAFYTPKEIVRYMCQEALISYLRNNTTIAAEKIEKFIQSPEENLVLIPNTQRNQLLRAFNNVKICDPAIGSGAFPMGLLNELVKCRLSLSENEDINLSELKKSIISNNIYGVDIEKGAVDIARLRFWLSIVVDEQSPTPLPNLDYKIMQGNSLLESFSGVDLSKLSYEVGKKKLDLHAELWEDATTSLQKSVTMYLEEYFSCSDHAEKNILQTKIANLIQKQLENKGIKPSILEELKKINIAANSDFFLWHAWFNEVFSRQDEKKGFDIVIGNPPYISTKGISAEDKKKYEKEWGFSDDAYNLFFFRGMGLLNHRGYLSFITSKTFWTTQTKRNLRDLLLSKQIDYIYDTGNPFEDALVDTCITAVSNKAFDGSSHKIRFYDGKEDFASPKVYSIHQEIFCNSQNSVIFTPSEQNLKLQQIFGKTVKKLHDLWWDKIKTSRDIEKNRKELESYRAGLKPGDIALLGCLTDGGQGLATANNGKYLAVKSTSKLAPKVRKARPEKLALAITQNHITIEGLEYSSQKKVLEKNCAAYLSTLSESEISELFDNLKEEYGRDIFGQGFVYKIAAEEELADIDKLTQQEKENGIPSNKPYFVPYDKGDKDGSRWYLETPFVIAWSEENVHFLKTDGRARYQGQQFYFKEGFCWNNVLNPNARLLKVRVKGSSVNDVGAMSLIPEFLPTCYLVAYLNSNLIFDYYREFINCTVNVQINDLRQVPVVIPTETALERIKTYVESFQADEDRAISFEEAEKLLDGIIFEICTRSK